MEKVYLKTFGGQNIRTYSIDEVRYRSEDGRTLEVVNNLRPMSKKPEKKIRQTAAIMGNHRSQRCVALSRIFKRLQPF